MLLAHLPLPVQQCHDLLCPVNHLQIIRGPLACGKAVRRSAWGALRRFVSSAAEVAKQLRQGHALGQKPVDCGAMCMPGLAEKVAELVDEAVHKGAQVGIWLHHHICAGSCKQQGSVYRLLDCVCTVSIPSVMLAELLIIAKYQKSWLTPVPVYAHTPGVSPHASQAASSACTAVCLCKW